MSIPHLVDRLVDLGEITQADIEWAEAKRAEFATMRIGAVLVREKLADTLPAQGWSPGSPF